MEKVKSFLGAEDETSIFAILRREHSQAKENLSQMINENRPMSEMFSQTRDALNSHMRGEESVLYPILETNASTRSLALASIEEHNMAKQVMNDMPTASASNEQWNAKIRVLNDLISRHVEVEENEVFPKAKAYITEDQAKNLGREYTSRTRI